jgi:hypothetical protein
MVHPRYPAAVVAGNVETSQVITDALYGALGVLAASQGTMNNFTFGTSEHQYYETICGGAGAGADFDGCDAIQTHMTNSRLTDPEVLEWRYPVRVDGFAVRVPTANVSLVDLTFKPRRATSVDEINKLVKSAADGALKGVLAYTEAPLVSVDYNHDPASSTYDATLTKIIDGNLVKVCSWYDNEWGFSNRMLDVAVALAQAK